MVIMTHEMFKTKCEKYISNSLYGKKLTMICSLCLALNSINLSVFSVLKALILNGKVIIIIKFYKKISTCTGIYLITETS